EPPLGAVPEVFTSRKGKFSVKFPVKPDESTKEVDAPFAKLTFWLFSCGDGSSGQFVGYSDYPEEAWRSRRAALLPSSLRGFGFGSGGLVLHSPGIRIPQAANLP